MTPETNSNLPSLSNSISCKTAQFASSSPQTFVTIVERQPWIDGHRGGKSVTELEIFDGVLNNPKMAGRALFYFRSSDYAKKKGGVYPPESPTYLGTL